MTEITGKQLIEWGFNPGKWFGAALKAVNEACRGDVDRAHLIEIVRNFEPAVVETIPLKASGRSYWQNIEATSVEEQQNVSAVHRTMCELMRTPTIKSGAIMPDACPAGPLGTIPVGGVVACENAIHPGFHSEDTCCSVAVSIFNKNLDALLPPDGITKLMDICERMTHFGPGKRTECVRHQQQSLFEDAGLLGQFVGNKFLTRFSQHAMDAFGTQGDGNHFLFLGRMRSTGQLAIVTHSGSRQPGAKLYRAGMECAEVWRRNYCPELPKQNAWIPADTDDGREYWAALQIIRKWTKANHYAIHDAIASHLGVRYADRFWNEHNFVFQRSDGLFYHGKGATPAWESFAGDSTGLTLIPLNMASPILVARGLDCMESLGFAPHGAGRNYSRTEHKRRLGDEPDHDVLRRETKGIDCRFWSGIPDVSELPSAYKDADSMVQQIENFGLAKIEDYIDPIGSIMAGDWQRNAPWRTKRG